MSTMESLKNKLRNKPIAKKEDVYINFPQDKGVTAVEEKESSAAPMISIIDRTDKPFDDKEFLAAISSKKKTKILKSPTLSIYQASIPEEKETELEIVPKPKSKIKKLKRKLDVSAFVIEDDENEAAKEKENKGDVVITANKIPEIVMGKDKEGEKEAEIEIVLEKPVKRKYTRKEVGVVELGTEPLVQIGDTPIDERMLTRKEPIDIRVSSYFQNNREIFVNFINDLFKPYKENLLDDKKNISCETMGKTDEEMSLLNHQKIVRDYINLNTPYRGLLLYHGLGSGKTCSSIAIAEGFQTNKQVIIMTPAYLRMNYIQEIKKCGNMLFRKNQFWEWADLKTNENSMNTLSAVLGLPREYIRKNNGAWLVNFSKPNNFDKLTNEQKNQIDAQLDEMITNKYKFINYNGLTKKKFKTLTDNYKTNIFDNAVVIIDEAHNLVSRIVNKINKVSIKSREYKSTKFPDVLSLKIYEMLLAANNARIVLLTGTPLVNYPNEIGILFNILRGYIKTWKFTLNTDENSKVDESTLKEIFYKDRTHDYLSYVASTKTLTITRNPFGFENKVTANSGYKGVYKQDESFISDTEFVEKVIKMLKKNNIRALELASEFKVYTALPDNLSEFSEQFINEDNGSVRNIEKFKRRIMGLPSYFRSAQEELLPSYDKIKDFHVIKIPMSDYQFQVYEGARQKEREREKPPSKNKKVDMNGLFVEPSSTYRIFSRLFCNFVMPQPPGRPISRTFILTESVNQTEFMYLLIMENKHRKKDFMAELQKKINSYNQDEEGKPEIVVDKPDEESEVEVEEEEEEEQEEEEEEADTKQSKVKTNVLDDPTNRVLAEDGIVQLGVQFPGLTLKQIIDYLSKHKKQSIDVTLKGLKYMEDPIANKHFKQNTDDDDLEMEGELETDDVLEGIQDLSYKKALQHAYQYLKEHSAEYLSPEGLEIYGRKMLAMLENITSKDHQGLHLVYSQFRTMEGIGIFILVLEQNGFTRFKIKRVGSGNDWDIDFPQEKLGSPMFGLYTGTEDDEEREIIRNIYNGDWKDLPPSIKQKIEAVSSNNNLGEIIKVLMITAAGSEGINLRNTRYVHLMEPYWHPVRTEQVVGRARRICSHKNLPKEFQNVEVFLYLMTLTPEQLKSDIAAELRVKDISKKYPYSPLTSDEKLFEISSIKEELNGQLLKAIKESSIDCSIHVKSSTKEKLTCLSFGKPSVNSFSYNPNYLQDENDNISTLNKTKITWRGKELTFNGKKMILREDTKEVYDYESYMNALETPGIVPIIIGKLEKSKEGKYKIITS